MQCDICETTIDHQPNALKITPLGDGEIKDERHVCGADCLYKMLVWLRDPACPNPIETDDDGYDH